jgi:simple sugar transport system permease protein
VIDAATLLLAVSTLRLATPLALAAMGELVAERAGVLNIGIEGMMLAGALAAFATGAATGSSSAGCVAGIAAGVAMSSLFAFFVLRRAADPIVAGTALNVLALGLTGVLFRSLNPPGSALARAPQMGRSRQGYSPGRGSVRRRHLRAPGSRARRSCSGSRTRSSRA